MKTGDVVTYVCHEFEHNALVWECNGTVVKLIHFVSYNGRTMPQVEVGVHKDVPDVDGRYWRKRNEQD